jgi:Mg-chelatase subunit ChlD
LGFLFYFSFFLFSHSYDTNDKPTTTQLLPNLLCKKKKKKKKMTNTEVAPSTNSSQVNVLAIPDNSYVVNGVLNTKQVLFDLVTSPKVVVGEEPPRAPLNLCVVLDRSGSMASGDKLTFAKEAIVSVLNLLKGN